METDAQYATDPPADRKTYNGIEHFPIMEMGLAHYRTLDSGERGRASHVVTRARSETERSPRNAAAQHEEHQRSHHTFHWKVLVWKREMVTGRSGGRKVLPPLPLQLHGQ